MNIAYNNELRTYLIGQDFETPLETLEELDVVRDVFLFQGVCV